LHYHYDGERNLIGLTNEKGERYQLDYDLNERLIQEVGFDGRIQRYNYNAAGQLQASQDFARDGINLINQINYTRRVDGRLLKQIDALSQTVIAEYNYDAAGQITRAKNSARELQWKYDPAGRIIEDWQDQNQISHTYNASGERTQSRLPNGEQITYSYNANSQFAGMAFNQQTVVAIAHDSMGRELKRMLGNQLETEYRYDPQGRLSAQRTGKRDQENKFTPITQRNYQYNAYGQLAQIDDQLRGTTRYHYDVLERLTQVDGPNPETFIHDPAGNILGTNENSDAVNRQQSNGNRLAFYGDNHYTYDDRGNRILNAHGKNKSLQQRFTYNALNQLESVENQQQKITYQYDALGRRISKRNSTSETNFLWLDNTLLSETTTQLANRTQTAKIYLFEPGTHKPLAVVQDNEIYHYHLDHLGTPQEITNSRGKLAWSASFKAYGNLAVVHNNDIENNLRFQGQYFDEETGLHYNRFRYYDPECGRFISQDPIGLLGGVNNYQYVPNPTGWIDPMGLSCKVVKYNSTPLLEDYVGEEDPSNLDRWNTMFSDDSVCAYLDENQRKPFEVTVEDGLLVYKDGVNKGQLVDTGHMSSLHSSNPSAIFVMSPQGSIYLGSHGRPGSFHHSSFLSGGDVASAGEMIVKDGKIIEVSNKSGHYKPAQTLNDQLFDELGDKGMAKSDIGNITRTGVDDSGKKMSPTKQSKIQEAKDWKPGDPIPYDWDGV
jgi:RHS repeat-associated protein